LACPETIVCENIAGQRATEPQRVPITVSAATSSERTLQYTGTMTIAGYARVSTNDQNLDLQADRLAAAGCDPEHVYLDHASGKLAHRPEWDRCRNYLRAGDTLVITKLDRIGRSVKNLIEIIEWLETGGIGLRVIDQGIDTTTPAGKLFFHLVAAFAEFEHAMIVERTKEGLAAARARGRMGGSRPKLTARQAARARELYDSLGADGKRLHTVTEIGNVFSVSRQTIYRALENSR
jgi:DNA invertase Pin-like site-specific DNA recombinase